jgi:hypothetical protein
MGLAFSAGAGGPDSQASPALLKCTAIYDHVANVLLNVHYLIMPVYFLVTLGLFLWKSHELGILLAKISFVLPLISFLSLGLFFLIAWKLGR